MDSIPWVRCASGNVYKTQEVVFLIFVSHISCNQNCISFYPQNSYNFALTMARQTGRDESEVCSHAISRLSLLLMKGNSAILVNRIPSITHGPIDGVPDE